MKTFLSFLLIAVCAAGTSCIGAKKMDAARERLNTIKEGQRNEVNRLNQISANSSTRMNENKIDSVINSRFDYRVGRIHIEMDSVSGEINELDSLMAERKLFRQAFKKIIIPKLDLLDSFRLENAKRNQVYLMMEDGLNSATYSLFDLAAFFGPGKYAIPQEQEEITANSFAPLVDSVINFSKRYSKFSQTATLVILGFADGTGFDPESDLYAELAGLIGRVDVSKQELNQKLSELRAETLIRQLRSQFTKKMGGREETENFKIEFLGLGKGERFPFTSVTDYKEEDERRRIVLCYWAVLPR
ncbi:MAG: hypothetical protein JNM19_04045 [Chitinophagaceae bacterium]|nr:hypothetical protein [Chitinophagaceae bacterium]